GLVTSAARKASTICVSRWVKEDPWSRLIPSADADGTDSSTHRSTRFLDEIILSFDALESAVQIVWQRCGTVDGTGVQPDEIRAGIVSLLHGPRQKVFAQPPADELAQQSKVGQLSRAVCRLPHLKIACLFAVARHQPH